MARQRTDHALTAPRGWTHDGGDLLAAGRDRGAATRMWQRCELPPRRVLASRRGEGGQRGGGTATDSAPPGTSTIVTAATEGLSACRRNFRLLKVGRATSVDQRTSVETPAARPPRCLHAETAWRTSVARSDAARQPRLPGCGRQADPPPQETVYPSVRLTVCLKFRARPYRSRLCNACSKDKPGLGGRPTPVPNGVNAWHNQAACRLTEGELFFAP